MSPDDAAASCLPMLYLSDRLRWLSWAMLGVLAPLLVLSFGLDVFRMNSAVSFQGALSVYGFAMFTLVCAALYHTCVQRIEGRAGLALACLVLGFVGAIGIISPNVGNAPQL